jgi:hypothetical protein
MSNGSEIHVQDIVRNAHGETLVIGIPNRRIDSVKVGDVFTLRYEISSEDARQGVPNPARLNIKEVSLRITKIEANRQGLEILELDGRSGAAGGLHLSGIGLEEVTPGCLLHT